MKRRLLFFLVIPLVALGALGDHILNQTLNKPVAAAVTPIPVQTVANNAAALETTGNTAISPIDQATEHAYAVASPSVVYVESVGVGSGSGVIYDSAGDIITNNHVVSGASQLRVTLNSGQTVPATLVGVDKVDDLAVIRINATGVTAARFASAGSYHLAQTVLSIGSPLGLKQSVTSGLISGLGRVEQEPGGAYLPNAIQTSAPINPGNSGGALVTLDGTVVGVPTLVQSSSPNGTATQNIGFAIPSERVVSVANQIIATGKVQHTGRAYLGLAPTDSTNQSPFGTNGFSPDPSTPSVAGALVSRISPNGPAGRAGIQQGDVITSVEGHSVATAEDLLTTLAHKKPGDTIALKLNRNGSTVSVSVRLRRTPRQLKQV